MIFSYYRNKIDAFRDAYEYYSHFERSDYGGGGGGDEYCCGNEYLDQELTARVLLIVLLVFIIFALFYLYVITALNGSSGRRLGTRRHSRTQSITDESSSTGQYPFSSHVEQTKVASYKRLFARLTNGKKILLQRF